MRPRELRADAVLRDRLVVVVVPRDRLVAVVLRALELRARLVDRARGALGVRRERGREEAAR